MSVCTSKKSKPIFDISPFSLLDFGEKPCCIVWFPTCNLRCSYCYNPHLTAGEGTMSLDALEGLLDKRKGLLEGVVFSGGECTLYEGLEDLLRLVKGKGFATKLDTNGTKPKTIKDLLSKGLVDFIALDLKALNPRVYKEITGKEITPVLETLDLLLSSDVSFEVRTTVHTAYFSEETLIEQINFVADKGYKGTYGVQKFKDTKTLRPLNGGVFFDRDYIQKMTKINVDFRNF